MYMRKGVCVSLSRNLIRSEAEAVRISKRRPHELCTEAERSTSKTEQKQARARVTEGPRRAKKNP
jgi:hypothetical protein